MVNRLVNKKVESHKDANDLPIFPNFYFILVSMMVMVVMVERVRVCDTFGTLEEMTTVARFIVIYMGHTAWWDSLKFYRTIHRLMASSFVM